MLRKRLQNIEKLPRTTRHEKDISSKQISKGVKRSLKGKTVFEKVMNDVTSYCDGIEKTRELEAFVLGAEDDVVDILKSSKVSKLVDLEPGLTSPKPDDDDYCQVSSSFGGRKPAWVDEDEDEEKTKLSLKAVRYKKIAKHGESEITKQEYTNRLKKRFEVVYGETPSWADLSVDKKKNDADLEEDESELFQKTGDYLSKDVKALAPTYLEWSFQPHANKSLQHKSTVSSIRFHKSSQIIMTAGKDHNLSFFKVDGERNAKIQNLFIHNFPIHCARFSSDYQSVVLGSRFKTFYEYDIVSGQLVTIQPIKALDRQPMSYFEVSPCGTYLAFRGTYGFIHILSYKSKELLCQFKMNGEVTSICFSPDGKYLYSHGSDGEVYVWELSSRSCIHKFVDEGCLKGSFIAVDSNNRFMACGSDCGVVNVYDVNSCFAKREPQPIKVVNNLLTQCTSLTFNSSSQLLAMGSSSTERSVKLLNMSALSVYQNFPSMMDSMTCPTDIDFSPNSGYLAAGTNSGIVHLYRLQHFAGY